MEVVDPLLALVNPNRSARGFAPDGTPLERVTADGKEYGYAGLRMDLDAVALDVYWVGPVESNVQRILDSAPSDVKVRVHEDASYSFFDMQDAVERVVAKPVSVAGLSGDSLIMAAGPEADGSGIWIEYSGDPVISDVLKVAHRWAGVKVTSALPSSPVEPTARWDGDEPWKGGGGYYVASHFCSWSFPVTSNATGAKLLLTADHCFDGLGSVPVWNDARTIGTAYTGSGYRNPSIDAALIKPTKQSISPRVYYGGWSTANLETITVVGGNVKDAMACTDGANSGMNCVVIAEAGYSEYIPAFGRTLHGLVRGSSPIPGQVVVVGGDSGGPVLYPHKTTGKYRAMGTIIAGSGSNTCPYVKYTQPIKKCHTTALWVGAITISSEMGMTIATG